MDEVSQTATGVIEAQPVTLRLYEEALTVRFEMERRDRTIPVSAITGVEHQVGLLTGGITVAIGAETIAITRIPRSEARTLVAALRALVRDRPAPIDPEPVAHDALPDTSPLAELERLARLRDAGVLTEEEFADAKRRLLDRL